MTSLPTNVNDIRGDGLEHREYHALLHKLIARLAAIGDSVSIYSNQSVPTGTYTQLILDTEDYSPIGSTLTHDSAGTVTIHANCILAANASVWFDGVSDSTARAANLNTPGLYEGNTVALPALNATSPTYFSASWTWRASAGDTIVLSAEHDHGSDLLTGGGLTVTCLGLL